MPTELPHWSAPIRSGPLVGCLVRLEPLLASHETELAEISRDLTIWRYLTSNAASPDDLHDYVDAALRDHRSGAAIPFVVRSEADRSLIGLTRLKNLSIQHRKATVGSWFAPTVWGTGANTESKYLLLAYAFESLHCLRVEFHTDSRNTRSRSALARMGAVEEGVLRSHLIANDGHRRDTVIFSVILEEWPYVKQGLERRIQTQRSGRP
jgi:RimJ/RimL family protein N-acetyltransferase